MYYSFVIMIMIMIMIMIVIIMIIIMCILIMIVVIIIIMCFITSGGRLCTLIGVPCRLSMLSTFSTFANDTTSHSTQQHLHPVSVRRFPSFRTQPLDNLTPLPVNRSFVCPHRCTLPSQHAQHFQHLCKCVVL